MVRIRLIKMVAAIGVAIVTAGPSNPSPTRAEDRRFIIAGETAWGGSFVSGDVTVANRLLAKDFSGTGSDGKIYDKQTILGWARKGPKFTSNSTIVASIRFFGDVAVVQGSDEIVGAPPQRDHHENAWTDVWARRKGRWQIVSAHDTRIIAKP